MSSTDVYCTNLTCYDKAVMYNDIQCNGNLHCGLGDVFCSQLDLDYAKVSTSLTVPRLTTNNAIINTKLTAPSIDVSQTLNTATLNSSQLNTSYATVNTSISSPYFDCMRMLNAANLNIGNTSVITVVGNFNVDVQTQD